MSKENDGLRFTRFLKACGAKGLTFITGGLFSFAISFYEHWKGSSLAAASFSAAAVIAILLGSYFAWADENLAKESLLAQRHSPDVSIILHSVSLAPSFGDDLAVVVLTKLSARNTGEPSILDTWQLTCDDYPGFRIEKIVNSEPFNWHHKSVVRTYSGKDYIDQKVAVQPIPTGGKQVGIMLWKIYGLDHRPFLENVAKLPLFTVTARDVMGTLIRSTNRAVDRTDEGLNYAGLDVPEDMP
jgi:hypothetical protein